MSSIFKELRRAIAEIEDGSKNPSVNITWDALFALPPNITLLILSDIDMLDSSIPKLFEPDETVHRTLALSQDNSKTVAERLEIIKPLLIYIQYFTEEIAQRVVNSLRSICKDMLNESLAIPTELIAISKTLHNFPPASLIYDYLLAPMFQKIRGFEFPECAMAAGVFHIDSDDVGRLLKVAIKKLKGTPIETIAALFLIRQMSGD